MAAQILYLTLFIGSFYVMVNTEVLSSLCNGKENGDSDLNTLCSNLIRDASKIRNRRSGGSYVRFGRSAESGRNYVRFGRSAEPKRSDYVRFGRSAEKPSADPSADYLKSFGSLDQHYNRNARSSEPANDDRNTELGLLENDDDLEELSKRYMRFGKKDEYDADIDEAKRYMRFGKKSVDDENEDIKRYMRFGRRYMRFGRGDELVGDDLKRYMRFGRDFADKRYMRFGRGDDDTTSTDDKRALAGKRYMRFGKRDNNTNDDLFKNLKSKLESNENSEEKRFDIKRYMRFGKRDDDSLLSEEDKRYMRFGRATKE